ncbi:MAG: chromosomal replication initiator protein DnaA [Ruminococcaceae bacterium]|nr:chromosomal replication initiator protein DnaA [Oscillospiraceae bacterium]
MSSQNYIEEIKEVWNMVKEAFRIKLSESTAKLWFGDLEILSCEDSIHDNTNTTEFTITMGTSSEFKFDIISKKYLSDIQNEFCRLLGLEVHVNLVFTGSASSDSISTSSVPSSVPSPVQRTENNVSTEKGFLDYKFEYTFENFIVGSTNKFAQAACVAVANHPAENYNPLFIYGNSGLGKTHLMYATINQMKKNNPNIKIIYTKGEDFTNQMISCLANKTMEDFRDKYRKCDVLLIDDIQFIAGKTSTQEEIFHTFNALHEEKKQIIFTSDRPPREIKPLEDRLVSRFEWGLIADIEPPDLELRIAIIKKKAEQINVMVPNDVLTFLGENLRSNIRQIEGAIKKLGALSFLSGKEITMELAHECISELLGGAEPVSVTVEKIFSAVFKKYGISKESITGKSQKKEIVTARHVAVYLIREITEMSYPNTAKIFNRDSSTIISSYNLIATRVFSDPLFSSEINDLKKEVIGG